MNPGSPAGLHEFALVQPYLIDVADVSAHACCVIKVDLNWDKAGYTDCFN
jgi:hypothetical protein